MRRSYTTRVPHSILQTDSTALRKWFVSRCLNWNQMYRRTLCHSFSDGTPRTGRMCRGCGRWRALEDKFTQIWTFSHYPVTPVWMESRVSQSAKTFLELCSRAVSQRSPERLKKMGESLFPYSLSKSSEALKPQTDLKGRFFYTPFQTRDFAVAAKLSISTHPCLKQVLQLF